MSFSSSKHNNEDLESSSGSEFCEDDFLACQNSEQESRSRSQKVKSKKGGKNFYNKIKERNENSEKADDDIGRRTTADKAPFAFQTEKNVNTKNIKVLQQNVIKLTEECKKLGIYVGELDSNEETLKFSEPDSSEEGKIHRENKLEDIKNQPPSSLHTKFHKQRVGGGTGNTKCYKKNSKKQHMMFLRKMVQHLEKLLKEYQTEEMKNKREGTRFDK